MTSSWLDDDDKLVAALGEALRAPEPIPPAIVEAAKSVYVWRTIDAELAALTYDSVMDDGLLAAVRSSAAAAAARTLMFETDEVALEVNVTDDGVSGQLVPAQPWVIEVHASDVPVATVRTDDLGRFSLGPLPAGPVRLACRAASGSGRIVTEWVAF